MTKPNTKQVTGREAIALALSGIAVSFAGNQPGRKTFLEVVTKMPSGATFVKVDGHDVALLDPKRETAHVISKHQQYGFITHLEVSNLHKIMFEFGYVRTGFYGKPGDGYPIMDVYEKSPVMYLVTTAECQEAIWANPVKGWVLGDHDFDPKKGGWEPHRSVALVGTCGYHVTPYIPDEVPGEFKVWAVDYQGPHDVQIDANTNNPVHAVGSIRILHEVVNPNKGA